jgi:hypothetical protein
MRTILGGAFFFLAAAAALAGCRPAGEPPVESPRQASAGGLSPGAAAGVLVRFRDGTGADDIARVCREVGMENVRTVARPYLFRLAVPEGMRVEEALARLRGRPEVEYAEPDFVRSLKEP